METERMDKRKISFTELEEEVVVAWEENKEHTIILIIIFICIVQLPLKQGSIKGENVTQDKSVIKKKMYATLFE